MTQLIQFATKFQFLKMIYDFCMLAGLQNLLPRTDCRLWAANIASAASQ
jgi:hypothetical protein